MIPYSYEFLIIQATRKRTIFHSYSKSLIFINIHSFLFSCGFIPYLLIHHRFTIIMQDQLQLLDQCPPLVCIFTFTILFSIPTLFSVVSMKFRANHFYSSSHSMWTQWRRKELPHQQAHDRIS